MNILKGQGVIWYKDNDLEERPFNDEGEPGGIQNKISRIQRNINREFSNLMQEEDYARNFLAGMRRTLQNIQPYVLKTYTYTNERKIRSVTGTLKALKNLFDTFIEMCEDFAEVLSRERGETKLHKERDRLLNERNDLKKAIKNNFPKQEFTHPDDARTWNRGEEIARRKKEAQRRINDIDERLPQLSEEIQKIEAIDNREEIIRRMDLRIEFKNLRRDVESMIKAANPPGSTSKGAAMVKATTEQANALVTAKVKSLAAAKSKEQTTRTQPPKASIAKHKASSIAAPKASIAKHKVSPGAVPKVSNTLQHKAPSIAVPKAPPIAKAKASRPKAKAPTPKPKIFSQILQGEFLPGDDNVSVVSQTGSSSF